MKFSMKLLNMLYLPSKDEQQKSPESVGFVPHSHFFLIKLQEVCKKLKVQSYALLMSDISQTDYSPH